MNNKVENLKGELVKRKPDAKKVYMVAGYCKINRAYQLDDYNDSSRSIYVKKGTVLFTEFTY